MRWQDILTIPPADGDWILARRYPEDTPDIYGQWSIADAGLRLANPPGRQPDWIIPWTFLTHWCKPATPPPWPGAAHPKSWRDPYYYPPADGQSVWLRRHPGDCPAIPAVYSAADGTFAVNVAQSHQLAAPFYCFYQWKPM